MTAAKPRPLRLLSDRKKLRFANILALPKSSVSDHYTSVSPVRTMEVTMDPLFLAWSYFRRRKLQQCSDICTRILQDSPYDQVLCCC